MHVLLDNVIANGKRLDTLEILRECQEKHQPQIYEKLQAKQM